MVKNARKRWTEAEVAKLKSLAGNYPVEEIAKEVGRGIPATVMKAHELQVSLRMKRKHGSREGTIDPRSCRHGFDLIAATRAARPQSGPSTRPGRR